MCIHHDVCRYPLEGRANPDTCWKYEEERQHGEWEQILPFSTGKCSFCGNVANITNFCPNCGADMRGKEELNRVSKELNSEICPCIECCEIDNSEPCRKGCSVYQKWKEGEEQ